jgi:pimeloyl-ACP methyl ester carboxylesterase
MTLSATVLGKGRPVVLLPGFALDGAVMAAACEPAFARAQAEAGSGGPWQRIYLDLPGTGGSPAGEPTSEAVLLAVQAAVTTLLGDAPYLLAGHSYGGYLATGLVRRDPARVAGLFLITCGLRIRPADRDLTGVQPSTPEPGWLEHVPEDLHQHFEHAIGKQTRSVADRVAGAFAGRGPVDEQYLDALRPAGYRLTDEDTLGTEPPAAGPRFPGPVSLLAGRRDRIGGYRDAFTALTQYPNGSYIAVADAGHYLPFERPDRFAGAIRDWLTESSGSPAKAAGLAVDGPGPGLRA